MRLTVVLGGFRSFHMFKYLLGGKTLVKLQFGVQLVFAHWENVIIWGSEEPGLIAQF